MLSVLFLPNLVSGQVYTRDVEHFWVAFDSVRTTNDADLQKKFIKELYFDKGSPGFREFVRLRDWTPEKFLYHMTRHERFWETVRPRTLAIKAEVPEIKRVIRRYEKLYKDFKRPEIYFVMGYTETGGTTNQTQVLMGTEIVAADSSVDAEGLHPMVQSFMKLNKGAFSLVAHELTHTQQKGGDMENRRNSNLLGFSLAEGSCDFMAELITKKTLHTPYTVYGGQHEKEIWTRFKKEMHGKSMSDWLYNASSKRNGDADLGYFVGYAICKAYYQQAGNKKQAISDIITLDFENLRALDLFLERSGYGKQFK